jgi:hypothetical protein
MAITESRVRVVSTAASYSGGSGFNSRPGDRLCRLFLWFSSLLPGNVS